MVFCVVCCLPAVSVAQATPVLGKPSVVPSILNWEQNYTLSVIALSGSQPTQATTLTLYIEVDGVRKRIDETAYGLADEFLPLQKEILIPSIAPTTSHEVRVQGRTGSGLSGTTTFRYCDDAQSVCTDTFEVDYRSDPPSRDINGSYQLSITTSTVAFGRCAAVRERTQRIEITQSDHTASYRFTDDFGISATLNGVVSTNTYVYTAQYSTAPTFPGTSTVIVRADFTDNNNGNGLAHWSYQGEDGEDCRGEYRIRYSRVLERLSAEGIQVRLKVFLEGALMGSSHIVSSVLLPQRVQDIVLSRSGVLYALDEGHTLWTVEPSGSRRQMVGATTKGDQVDIHDLIFVEQSLRSDTLYVVDAFLRAVIAVDLSDGSRTVVSGCDIINRCPSGHYQVGGGVPLMQPTDAVLDEVNNRLILTDAYLAALVAVNLTSGERSVVAGCTTPDLCIGDELNVGDGISLLHPPALDMNSSATRIVVVDDALDALFVVDAVTGDRAIVSGCRVRDVCVIDERGLGPSFDRPVAVVLDEDADLAYVADNGLQAIIEVDLGAGHRSDVLSSSTVRKPYHLSLDRVGNRILVYDEADGTSTAINQPTGKPTRVATYTKQSAPSPRPPYNLGAEVRDDAVVLNWQQVPRATSYKIYWNTFADIKGGRADQVISDIYGNSYVHSGLVRGQLYYYAVSAVNEGGESKLNDAVSVMLPVLTGNDEIPPTPPRIVSIHASSNTAIALDWMASVDDRSAAEQIVYEVHVAESTATVASDTTKRVMVQGVYSAGVGGLETSQTYYVRVAALDEAGNRSLSEHIAIRTMSRPPMISTQNRVMLVEINAPPDADGVIVIDRRDDLEVDYIIIARNDEEMYLRRITGIEFFGNQMRLSTESASLQDAFASLDLNLSVKLEDVDDGAAIAAAKSASVQASQRDETVQRQDSRLRQFLPALQPREPPSAVWPYQPTYEGNEQIREMYWPDSGFRLRRTDFISQADDGDSDDSIDGVGVRIDGIGLHIDGVGVHSEQPTPEIHIPGTYQAKDIRDIKVFYPRSEVIEAGEVASFDIYVERLNKQCTIDSVDLESITQQGENISLAGTKVREKRTDASARVTEYRLTWQTDKDLGDRKPYKMNVSVRSPCATLSFTVEVYVSRDLGAIALKEESFSFGVEQLKVISEVKLFDFVPQVDIRRSDEDLEAVVSGEIDLNVLLKLVAGLEGGLEKRMPFFSTKFYLITLVGPVPVLVSGTLTVNAGVDAKVSGKLEIDQEFASNYKFKAGFRWVDRQFQPISSRSNSTEYKITVKREVKGVEVEFSIFPEFKLELYETIFTSINLKPHVYGEVRAEGLFSRNNYRFTKVDAGVGISSDVSAGLEKWVRIFTPLDLVYTYEIFNSRHKVTSLPTIEIEGAANNVYTAGIKAGKWFSGMNDIQEGSWSVVPPNEAVKLVEMGRDRVRIDTTQPIERGKHRLRYTGSSLYGTAIRQYSEEYLPEITPSPEVTPLSIITPTDSTAYNLSTGDASGTTVTVVVEASNTDTPVTMTLELNDGGTSIVSLPTSPITLTQADDDNTQRTAQFKLTAVGAGNTTLKIVVTDSSGNKDEVQVRVAVIRVPEITPLPEVTPLSIITPTDSTTYNLATDDASGTTVTVVVEASNTDTPVTMTLELNDGGTSIVSLPTSPITLTQADDNTQRTAQFKLTAVGAGNTTLKIVVSDSSGNKDEVQVRVVVIRVPEITPSPEVTPLSIITPTDSTAYNLSTGDASGTTVTVVVEASNTDTPVTMTLELNDGGTSIVSLPTSPITLAQADDDNTQRTAQFKLTAVGAGNTTLKIVVTDSSGNKDEVQVRVAVIRVPEITPLPAVTPLSIITPTDSTTYNLSTDDASGTTVTVVVETSNTDTPVTMTLELNDGGTSIVSLPTSPITLTQVNADNTQRTAQFKLTAVGAGNTTLTIVVTDSSGNKDEVQVRVAVIRVGEICTTCVVPDMVVVPAGSFIMGSPVDEVGRSSDEGPQHRVTISQPFAVGKYEVTRGQFKAFVDATGYDWRHIGFRRTNAHPAVNVSWNDAKAYVNWLSARTSQNYRLLSEAEWEYVARAGTTTAYHFGNTISPNQANYYSEGTVAVSYAVGSYPANAFGLHDVHGSVWEWVEDCWHNDYTGAPTDGSAWVSDCDKGYDYRVLRGGSWSDDLSRVLRSAYRVRNEARSRYRNVGFRIARTLTLEVTPLSIITPPDSTTYHLSTSDASSTTVVTVVVEASTTNTPITMTLELNDGGTSIVSLPTSLITLAQAGDDNPQRTAQFKLTAVGVGNTTLTIVVSDSFGNKDEVQVRVAVIRVGEICTTCVVPDMVIVPAGSFTMGSPADELGRDSDEGPQHRVTISQPFAVGKDEVTRGQFKAFVDATEYDAGDDWLDPVFEQTDAHPVVYVSWNDAKAYVNWLSARTGQNYRLLSEAEWEYVARAGTTTAYHFGNTISRNQANYWYDGRSLPEYAGTVAVGSYHANAFGLHDVHGSVWEWVEDCWHNDYTGAPTNGSAWVSDCEYVDVRVLRGGSWRSSTRNLRSAYRLGLGAWGRDSNFGFRIARTLTP